MRLRFSFLSLLTLILAAAILLSACASTPAPGGETDTDRQKGEPTEAEQPTETSMTSSETASEPETDHTFGISIPCLSGASYQIDSSTEGRTDFNLYAKAEDQNGEVVQKMLIPFAEGTHIRIAARMASQNTLAIAIWRDQGSQRDDGSYYVFGAVQFYYVYSSSVKEPTNPWPYLYNETAYTKSFNLNYTDPLMPSKMAEVAPQYQILTFTSNDATDFFNEDSTLSGPIYVLYESDGTTESFLQEVTELSEFSFLKIQELGF